MQEEPSPIMGCATAVVSLLLAALACLQPALCSDNTTDSLQATIAEQSQKLTQLETVIMKQAGKLVKADAMLERLAAAVGSLQTQLQTGVSQGGT